MLEKYLNEENLLFIVFIGAFILTYIIIPKIIGVVEQRKLMDNPNIRSSHSQKTPTLGGISFFITIIVSLFFLYNWDKDSGFIYLMPALTILFITGLKDDIVILSAKSKLLAQIIASVFVLSGPTMHIVSLNGFLGIYAIPFYISFPVSLFLMVTIINAYNLIDGIDGLAAITGVIISFCFALIFYYLDNYYYFLLSITVMAILFAFLRYNLSGSKKIFMGDTGSLLIGLMIAVFTIQFFATPVELLGKLPFYIDNLPFIILSILIIPIYDLVRVFVIRLMKKQSPFNADRNHLHHILIDFGTSHKKASLIIGFFNILFVLLISYLGTVINNGWMLLTFVIIIIIATYVLYRLNLKYSNLKKRVQNRKAINKFKNKFKKQNL